MGNIKRTFSLLAVFLLFVIGVVANSPSALAYSGSASGGGLCWLNVHTPNPVATFTVTSPADAVLYRYADLSLHTGQGTDSFIYLNGVQIATMHVPNGPGGYSDQQWLDFDLTSAIGPLVNGVYNFSCTSNNWSCTGFTNSCAVSQKPNCVLSSNPANVVFGDSSTLSWTTENAGSASINTNPVYNIPTADLASGNTTVTPSNPGINTYTLTVNSFVGGTKTCTADVAVGPPNCVLFASPASVISGKSANLGWKTRGAVSASIDNGIGNVTPVDAGAVVIDSIITAKTYTMTILGIDNNNYTCSINIGIIAPVTFDFTSPISNSDIVKIITNFLKWILSVAGSIAIIVIVIGGTMYISSAGNEQKTTNAKKAFWSAILGLAIILASYAILIIIDAIFT